MDGLTVTNVLLFVGFLGIYSELRAIRGQLDLWLRYLAERKQAELGLGP